ncbi:MAG: hypothetical protein O2904_01850 [bacterium]|nr:hypothetical protein [bacterium]
MRNPTTSLITLCALLISAIPTVKAAPEVGQRYPILAPCSRYEDRYTDVADFLNMQFEDWDDIYHEQISAAIEEYIKPAEEIKCTQDNLLPVSAGSAIGRIARSLPPWAEPDEFAKLKRTDIGSVLLEYLRTYECAMTDHNFFLPIDIITQKFEEAAGGGPPLQFIRGFSLMSVAAEMGARRIKMMEEFAISRPSLERSLMVVSGIGRLGPIDAELQCLQRGSLDLRNALALGADAAMCLPRVWDARDVLRDIEDG